jgi:hypothetical protein
VLLTRQEIYTGALPDATLSIFKLGTAALMVPIMEQAGEIYT